MENIIIRGLRFSLVTPELRQLMVEQAGRLGHWINTHPNADATLLVWRRELHTMLLFSAEHLVHNASYDLDRNEVLSLFQTFED